MAVTTWGVVLLWAVAFVAFVLLYLKAANLHESLKKKGLGARWYLVFLVGAMAMTAGLIIAEKDGYLDGYDLGVIQSAEGLVVVDTLSNGELHVTRIDPYEVP